MNLHTLIHTNNRCYKTGKLIQVKGIQVHTSGCNAPWLKRWVGPDDGLLGHNQYGNHWNRDDPNLDTCANAWIGKLADGTVATYQCLPWNMRCWLSGSGSKGNANNTMIGFEIAEDGLTDAAYFNAVYREATELCAFLCGMFGLNPMQDGVILGHYEMAARGIASNHGDPKNWFPKFGKSMDSFRADVQALMSAGTVNTPIDTAPPPEPAITPPAQSEQVIHTVASGDTLYALAKRYGTTVDAIAAANNLANPNMIRVGQKLIVLGVG